MEYSNVTGIEKKISRLVQGCIMLTRQKKEEGFALLDAARAAGITAYDTGHIYGGGDCDRMLGLWMEERGNREEAVIIGKGAHLNQDRNRVTPYDIASDMADTLVRLRSNYVDLYLLHRDDPSVPVGPIIDALNEHHAAGRIHAFGGSNWTPERIAEANEYADKKGLVPFAVSSPNFSLAEQVEEPWTDCLSISGASQEAVVEVAGHGAGVGEIAVDVEDAALNDRRTGVHIVTEDIGIRCDVVHTVRSGGGRLG